MKPFKNNFKLYSLTILNFTIIPSYYDLIRFSKFIAKAIKKDFPFKIQKSGIQYQLNKFKALFDTQIKYKPYQQNSFNLAVSKAIFNANNKIRKLNVLSD